MNQVSNFIRHGLVAVAALFLANVCLAKTIEPRSAPPGKSDEGYPPEIFAIIEALGGDFSKTPIARSSKGKSSGVVAAGDDENLDGSLKSSHSSFAGQLLGGHKKAVLNWKSRHKNTVQRWKRQQAEYFQKIPIYKNSLVDFEVHSPINRAKAQKPVTSSQIEGLHVVGRAFYPDIKDQGRRSTCAAFAAMRAVEIILAQNMINADLSEQYFYWASKPKCQTKRCSKRGSWVTPGFTHSQSSVRSDIPKEAACPYSDKMKSSNVTHVPLSYSCRTSGKTRVKGFVNIDTLDDAIAALNENIPVIAGLTLSPNFYRNNGLVGLTTKATAKVNAHSKGHALLLVGYMKLPQRLRSSEGNVCFVVANSWGEGWGVGGYSCLTENWIRRHRLNMSFVGVSVVGL